MILFDNQAKLSYLQVIYFQISSFHLGLYTSPFYILITIRRLKNTNLIKRTGKNNYIRFKTPLKIMDTGRSYATICFYKEFLDTKDMSQQKHNSVKNGLTTKQVCSICLWDRKSILFSLVLQSENFKMKKKSSFTMYYVNVKFFLNRNSPI